MNRTARRTQPARVAYWQRQPELAGGSLPAVSGVPAAPGLAATGYAAAANAFRSTDAHPLADAQQSAALESRAHDIETAFAGIEPTLRRLAARQFDSGFVAAARAELEAMLGCEVPEQLLEADWARPLDVRRLHAYCVLGVFRRLMTRNVDRDLARMSEGDDALELIHRWGFHAADLTPCADGRLSAVTDFILRIPPAIVAYRKSYAGALFDVEESLRHWEAVELKRWREGVPNKPEAGTRFLKVGIYHFSSVDPAHEGCAAHGSDGARAAGALLERLQQFALAVEHTYGCGSCVATLLIGVDTDTDAIRVHVPDAAGAMSVARCVDNADLYNATRMLSRDAAKAAIRDAVAACAGVAADDAPTEGMRWFCGYLLKNNIAQIDAVRSRHGASYADRGHTERLIIVGDAVEDVQLRNLAFQAQMETAEEGATDLDVGLKILRGLHAPRHLAVPLLVHLRYDARIPGARERAAGRAQRLQAAIEARYRDVLAAGGLYVSTVLRAKENDA